MGSSASGAETTYNVSFQLPDAVTIGSFRVEFCNVDPLPGQDCSTGLLESDNVPDLGDDAGTIITIANFAIADTAGDTTNNASNCTSGTLNTDHSTATGNPDFNHLDVVCNAAETTSVTETGPGTTADTEYVNFDIVNVNNPSNTTSGNNNDSFYVRVYVFAGTSPTAYNQASPPLGVYEGGIAMSTADQITLSARVQERLTFTVGTELDGNNCAAIAGTTVDLGVLDTGNINRISTQPTGGDLDVACAEVTTNAANGVNVYYIGDDLKVTGASCSGSTEDDAGAASDVDKCINADSDGSAGTSTVIVAGDEQWGMAAPETPDNGTTSNNLTAVGAYDESVANQFSFQPNVATLIGSSSTVVDQESLEIDMAGTASITTPTGLYTTTLTFIATATF
jgi:hypothetical protein